MKLFSPTRESDASLGKSALRVLALCLATSTLGRGQQASTAAPGASKASVAAANGLNSADQLDRAIAIVNGDLILDSDVDKELRFQALNFDPGSGQDPAAATVSSGRNEAIERLINRELILQQLRLQDEPPISDDVLDNQISLLRQTLPGCSKHECDSEAGWESYLKAKGFTVSTFREYWRERLQVLSFVEERFRSGIRIDPPSISDYYEKTLVPRYKAANTQAPPLDKVSERIQAILIERQVSKLLNDWLQSLRAQGGVAILHPGQSAP